MTRIEAIDLTDVALWMSDPYTVLRRLRETDPVHWHTPAPGNITHDHPFWALTRHKDIAHVSRHPEIFSSAQGHQTLTLGTGFTDYDTFAMLGVDDPLHAWMRGIVSSAFTAKMVIQAESVIREQVCALLDALAPRKHEEIDFVHEISAAVPVQVIGDLLGFPREDQHLIREWTDAVMDVDDLVIDFEARTAFSAKGAAAVTEMFEYLERMQRIREENPTEDLVSRLMAAEINGEKLTWRQQREVFFVLVGAGNDTTRNTASAGTRALFDNPDQRADLAADYSLMRSAVEEMLRWGSVVTHFRRTATEDTEIGGKQIKKGDWVVLFYTAANRDPEAFENPDKFNIRRNPNEQMAFGGGGPHFCLGAPLARLELRIIFEEFLRRYPNYEITGDTPYITSNLFHGIKKMPMILEPR
ncbi:cytochrome P450 [Nocardia sp. R6R-6]|uniref:cytochrome P450 n=1 Tax=Nocardia sp. R6R-6 TaxID=3459303 RepID=UPI00403DCC27